MYKTTRRSRAGFTLIELLTVIAIIGILAAIIIPSVGAVQKKAKQTSDGSNMRQLGQSALIYAQDNKDRLPPLNLDPSSGTNFARPKTGATSGTTFYLVAAALAVSGGVNDANFWVSTIDENLTAAGETANVGLSTIVNGTKTDFTTGFNTIQPSIAVVAGLSSSDPATTPVMFTRGLSTTGRWTPTDGVYKDSGGYVYFIGGNLAYYKSTGTSDGATGNGEFVDTSGVKTNNILKAIKSTRSVFSYGSNTADTASSTGTAGTGS